MFSLESFNKILYKNLLLPLNIHYFHFENFGSTHPSDLAIIGESPLTHSHNPLTFAIISDQEPFSDSHITDIFTANPSTLQNDWAYTLSVHYTNFDDISLKIYANSEHSIEKTNSLEYWKFLDWYYFYHGFAALDWYRNVEYLPPVKSFTKVFISFNNLMSENRSYRLNLIAQLIDKKLDQHGYISLNQNDTEQKIKNELFSSSSRLSVAAKKLILKTLLPTTPKLTIDTEDHRVQNPVDQVGSLSAYDNIETLGSGLFHLVTETVFYDKKLHLTEKIFKPIIARRPFFLIAAPHNLAYFKTYGFKTFDKWIDESYDIEEDNDKRIALIVAEVDRLCQLSSDELDIMYQEMQEILEYNFHWFYNGFKQIIVNELVDNFKHCIDQHNFSFTQNSRQHIDYTNVNFGKIKKLLSQ